MLREKYSISLTDIQALNIKSASINHQARQLFDQGDSASPG